MGTKKYVVESESVSDLEIMPSISALDMFSMEAKYYDNRKSFQEQYVMGSQMRPNPN